MNHRLQIQKVLSTVYSAKAALYLDPTLMSSKTVTAQVGQLNLATSMLKSLLVDMESSTLDHSQPGEHE